MVGSSATAFEEAYAARGVGGRRGDDDLKIGPRDMVRAGTGDEQAAGAQHFERTQVQFLITAQGAFDGAFGFGEGRRIEDDGVEGFAGMRPVAQNLEGVGFDPVDFALDARVVGLEVAFRDFERSARGVNAGDLAADLGEVQSESALIAADIEGAGRSCEALRPVARGGVIGALVEKGAGFLAGVGVVVKGEAVQVKVRAGEGMRGIGEPEWIGARCGKAFELADARFGALDDRRGLHLFAQDADAGLAYAGSEQAFGEELHDDERAVFVDDEAGQLVGFAEAEAAGVVGGVEHGLAARDGRAQTAFEQLEKGGVIEGVARYEAQSDLRDRAVESGAEEDSAVVGHRHQGFFWMGRDDCFDVGCKNPEMAGAEPVGGAAIDHGAGWRRLRWRTRCGGRGG